MSAARSRTHPAPLMGAQLVFNIGFYAVVPFIAVVLSEDFALGGSAVGLVLGIRTFAQQGLFLIGGTLADRFGARAIILTGCAVRAAGFATIPPTFSSTDLASDLGLHQKTNFIYPTGFARPRHPATHPVASCLAGVSPPR